MSVKDITLLRNVEVSMTRVIGNDAHALDVLYPHVRNQYIIKRGLLFIVGQGPSTTSKKQYSIVPTLFLFNNRLLLGNSGHK